MKKKCAGIVIVAVSLLIAGPAWAGKGLEKLGGAIYKDLNLSINQNQSCMTCHHPSAGFADPANRTSPFFAPVSEGSIAGLFGGRNAPPAAYAGFSPIFHYDPAEGLFVGGLFWDGRATGRMDLSDTGGLGDGPTGDPLADQAKGPFGNPVEMALTFDNTAMTTEEAVVGIIQASDYADKFEKEFGPNAFANIGIAYNNASLAIAAFERSEKLNKFNSKFDKFVAEQGGDVSMFGVELVGEFRKYVGPPAGFKSKFLSREEADGLAIFNADSYVQMGMAEEGANGGMCYMCHLTENHVVPGDETTPANGPAAGEYNPMFTDFTYDNLGIPKNPQVDALAGAQPVDLGLGARTAEMDAAYGGSYPFVADEEGKFKVSTLRGIERTAPFGHNGFFATLEDIVHFYNTRDALPLCEDAGGTVGVDCWPAPEVASTVNGDELGNLGLTLDQEKKIVMFMKTLTD